MKYSLRQPIGYTQVGRKARQEDAVYPLFDAVTKEERVFVLCDGVGGSAHGDIASANASEIIQKYLAEQLQKNDYVTQEDVAKAVELSYDKLDELDTKDSSCSMATTLTCIAMHKDGVLAAHMGDSRIYQIRPGKGVMYQSSDHSLVNALLQAGELTEEEAENFPRKNVIIRAIQPNTKRMHAEMHLLTDVQSGDYFFLCCDGVLEQLTNKRLVEVLEMDCSDDEKLKLLEAESTDRTRDNYTAYLIPVQDVEGTSSVVPEEEELVATTIETDTQTEEQPATQDVSGEQKVDTQERPKGDSQIRPKGDAPRINQRPVPSTGGKKPNEVKQSKKSNKALYGLMVLFVIAIAGVCFALFGQKKEEPKKENPKPEKVKVEEEKPKKTTEEATKVFNEAMNAVKKAEEDYKQKEANYKNKWKKADTAIQQANLKKSNDSDKEKALNAAEEFKEPYYQLLNAKTNLDSLKKELITAKKEAKDVNADGNFESANEIITEIDNIISVANAELEKAEYVTAWANLQKMQKKVSQRNNDKLSDSLKILKEIFENANSKKLSAEVKIQKMTEQLAPLSKK